MRLGAVALVVGALSPTPASGAVAGREVDIAVQPEDGGVAILEVTAEGQTLTRSTDPTVVEGLATLIVITATVYRFDRTPSCGRYQNDSK